jgi:hypothetical protein
MTLLWLERLLSRPDALQTRQDAPHRAADTSPRDEARKRPATAREHRSALDEATAFLLDVLAMGLRPTKEVQAEAKARGIAWATLRRAMPKAGVKKRKVGFQGCWVLSLQTCSDNPNHKDTQVSKDAQDSVVNTFADEPKRSDRDLPEATGSPGRPDPDDVMVPPGFTIPPGVECVCWDLKPVPLKLDRGVTVSNAEDLVKRHLEILPAKLRGEQGWLYEQWPLATLLADLAAVGVELRILE